MATSWTRPITRLWAGMPKIKRKLSEADDMMKYLSNSLDDDFDGQTRQGFVASASAGPLTAEAAGLTAAPGAKRRKTARAELPEDMPESIVRVETKPKYDSDSDDCLVGVFGKKRPAPETDHRVFAKPKAKAKRGGATAKAAAGAPVAASCCAEADDVSEAAASTAAPPSDADALSEISARGTGTRGKNLKKDRQVVAAANKHQSAVEHCRKADDLLEVMGDSRIHAVAPRQLTSLVQRLTMDSTADMYYHYELVLGSAGSEALLQKIREKQAACEAALPLTRALHPNKAVEAEKTTTYLGEALNKITITPPMSVRELHLKRSLAEHRAHDGCKLQLVNMLASAVSDDERRRLIRRSLR